MSTFDSSDFTEGLGAILSGIASTGTSVFVAGGIEAVSQNYSDSGFVEMGEETSAGTDSVSEIADGNTPALTTVFGLLSTFSGSSSAGAPDLIAIIRTENKKAYSVVEKKAKAIYDEYDKNHIEENDSETSLLTESPEVANAVNEIFSKVKSKYELIDQLELLEKAIVENDNNIKGKQKLLKKDE